MGPTMAEAEPGAEKPKPKKRPNRHRAGSGMVWSLTLAAVILTLLALTLSGKAMPLPDWARARIEASVSERMSEGSIELGKVAVAIGRDGIPRLQISDI